MTKDKLREEIYKISLTPINDIYFVPPGIDGSHGLSKDKIDQILSAIQEYTDELETGARIDELEVLLPEVDSVMVQDQTAQILIKDRIAELERGRNNETNLSGLL